MTAPSPTPLPIGEVERIAKGLTKAQRVICLESEPGAWGRQDDGTGAEIIGAGRWAVARELVRKGLGDIEESPGSYPPGLYFNNSLGIALRAHLIEQEAGR